ncbi:MAG: NAD(+) diphosphatase [Mycobacteriales bacterium]
MTDRARPALSRGTLDRHTADRPDEAFLDAAWAQAQLLVLTPEGRAPVSMGGLRLTVPEAAERPPDAFYLGQDELGPVFAVVSDAQPPARARLADLREIGADLDDRDAGLFVHAQALANWHRTHTHCPRCGAQTVSTHGGAERHCPVDDSRHFPRVDPAMIVIVTDPDGEQALLGRQATWPAGRYSTLAGFVEPGESAEQAVVREVLEETGVRVSEVCYEGSQPWPFPASLMLGFRAIADPAEPVSVPDGELDDARWFTRAEVLDGRMLPGPVSIAHRLIMWWARPDA